MAAAVAAQIDDSRTAKTALRWQCAARPVPLRAFGLPTAGVRFALVQPARAGSPGGALRAPSGLLAALAFTPLRGSSALRARGAPPAGLPPDQRLRRGFALRFAHLSGGNPAGGQPPPAAPPCAAPRCRGFALSLTLDLWTRLPARERSGAGLRPQITKKNLIQKSAVPTVSFRFAQGTFLSLASFFL